jgi:hypothetical protein
LLLPDLELADATVVVLDDTRLDLDGLVRLRACVMPRAVILGEVVLPDEVLLGTPPRCRRIAVSRSALFPRVE